MIFRPVVHPAWWIALFALAAVALLVLGVRRGATARRWPTVRRSLMAVLVTVMLAGPSVPGEARTITSNTEVWLVVDRTGSMAAEDWGSEGLPRLDGVREDARTILSSMAGARFSIQTWDSQLTTAVPLTTDESAVQSYLDTFHQEASEFSQGSAPDRPVQALARKLADARQKNPQNVRYLFVLTDGETSNTTETFDPSTWAPLADLVDGGLVIGYGTAQGGPMRAYRVGTGTGTGAGEGSSGAQSGETSMSGAGEPGGGDAEYIRDYSQPGAPVAISHIDEDALRGIADALGVDDVHSPDSSAIASAASSMMDGATLIAASREELSTYRFVIWPFATALAALVAWEVWAMAGRLRALRSSHAI